MDYGSLDTVIQKESRGYIWLEQRLKKNLAVTTLFVTACFLFIFILEILYGTGQKRSSNRIFQYFLLAVIRECTVAVCFLPEGIQRISVASRVFGSI